MSEFCNILSLYLLVAQSDRAWVSEAQGRGFNSRQGGLVLIYDVLYCIGVKLSRKILVGFFDSFKTFLNRIDKVESSVYGSQSLMEVYERNAKLEQKISQRTKELDRANKQMLTLQHVWNMMNSSEPLSSVLNTIVNSLQGELGYVYSFIIKPHMVGCDSYIQIAASSRDDFSEKFIRHFRCRLSDYKMKYPEIPELRNAVINNSIYQSTDLSELICGFLPGLDKDNVTAFFNEANMKSYILVPLISKKVHFGSLIVFSSRETISENELNFLGLFAKQIELAITIADLFQAVKEQAITDSMTGLYNRRYFEDFIKKEAIRADRQNQKFSIIGLDLDHLKQINDVYGHNYGDIAIKAIAEVIKNNARSIDVAARMGGEEFNIILPGVDSAGGLVAAERLRKAIEGVELEKIGHITASLGVSTYFEHSEDLDELLELTDQAMYESKRNGRNRVTVAKPAYATSWHEIAINTFVDILTKHRIPIDNITSKLLTDKLKELNNERLFQVADTLVSTYNPDHEMGTVKLKVQLATMLAKRFDLPKENVDKLKIAVLLYDIGNTMLPKDLLNKTEPLSEEDKISIKQHPVIAAREILKPITNVADIIPIIEKHHENWNGTGYPNNISGEEIPIESQIILIIDSYFALLENRPYRDARTKEDALKIIMGEINSKWSDKLANEFIGIVKNDLD